MSKMLKFQNAQVDVTIKIVKMGSYKYQFNVNIWQLFHWGPIIALSVILTISFTGLRCVLIWWPPVTTGGIIHIVIYCNWIFLVLYNYLLSAFKGPGFVPKGWKPVSGNLAGALMIKK